MAVSVTLSLEDVRSLSTEVLIANGMSQANADVIADVVTQAEADGTHSHGLFRVPGYVSSMRSGRMDGKAIPEVRDAGPGLVSVDSKNGFSPPAIVAGKPMAIEKAKSILSEGVKAKEAENIKQDVATFNSEVLKFRNYVKDKGPFQFHNKWRESYAILFGARTIDSPCPLPEPSTFPALWHAHAAALV